MFVYQKVLHKKSYSMAPVVSSFGSVFTLAALAAFPM